MRSEIPAFGPATSLVAIPASWLVFRTVEITLMLTPLALVTVAWHTWLTDQRPRDPRFVAGALLATLAGCAIIPFLLPAPVPGMVACVLATAACSAGALFLLPFAKSRAKWLAFTGSAMTLLFVAFFFFLFA